MKPQQICPASLRCLMQFYCYDEIQSPIPGYEQFAEKLASIHALKIVSRAANLLDYTYQITPLGRAWCKLILSTSIPAERTFFVDKDGNVIE